MTGKELQVFVRDTEAVFSPIEDNIHSFPSGRQLRADEVEVLVEMERWELVLTEW